MNVDDRSIAPGDLSIKSKAQNQPNSELNELHIESTKYQKSNRRIPKKGYINSDLTEVGGLRDSSKTEAQSMKALPPAESIGDQYTAPSMRNPLQVHQSNLEENENGHDS